MTDAKGFMLISVPRHKVPLLKSIVEIAIDGFEPETPNEKAIAELGEKLISHCEEYLNGTKEEKQTPSG